MHNPFDLFPDWFNQYVINDKIPWTDNIVSTLPDFLEEYTLHDSYWCGITSVPNDTTTIGIQLDAFWAKDKIDFTDAQKRDWPILFIQLQKTWQIKQGFNLDFQMTETISGATSQLLDEETKLQLFSSLDHEHKWFQEAVFDVPLYRTLIEPIYGGFVEILHGGETRFLLVGADGSNIVMPGL